MPIIEKETFQAAASSIPGLATMGYSIYLLYHGKRLRAYVAYACGTGLVTLGVYMSRTAWKPFTNWAQCDSPSPTGENLFVSNAQNTLLKAPDQRLKDVNENPEDLQQDKQAEKMSLYKIFNLAQTMRVINNKQQM